MEKTVVAKMTRLSNVVGRVDYISNPKRQENLLGFFQTPEDPAAFWRALSEESQELAGHNRSQIEEHNRIQNEKFATGEIKRKSLWSTVEAREIILALPNDLYGKVEAQGIAQFLAEDMKARYGIECAVGVHMNKTETNLHAHIILPERTMLEDVRESIATRNTYFDSEGKRSTKKICVDENGVLKPGCRMVRKGERLRQRRFSEKDSRFASKGFCYGEKLHFAKIFNEWSSDHWSVYNHLTNPHMRLYNLKRGEPEALRAWKLKENDKIRNYNAAIDQLINIGELTREQALEVKKEFYAARAAEREQRRELREAWQRWYENVPARRDAYHQHRYEERRRIRYADSGRERSTFELLAILGLSLAGIDVLKSAELDEDLFIRPSATVKATIDPQLQRMVDEICIAVGRKAPSELMAERKVKNLAVRSDRKLSLEEQIAGANASRSERPEIDGRSPPERER